MAATDRERTHRGGGDARPPRRPAAASGRKGAASAPAARPHASGGGPKGPGRKPAPAPRSHASAGTSPRRPAASAHPDRPRREAAAPRPGAPRRRSAIGPTAPNGTRAPRPSSRRRDPARVNRTRFGYPTVSERLAKSAGRVAPHRRSVVGSTVQHNGSLGYIGRGPFGRGSSQRRAARAGLLKVAPYALGAVVAVALLWGIGSAVQGGWSPLAFLVPASAPVELTGAARGIAGALEIPPEQSTLQVRSGGARVLTPGRVTATGTGRVTFSAVGDNLANENLLTIADAASGATGDGQYDFNAFYDGIRDEIQGYDIAFVNQETTLGGPDRYGYNGYPSYNTPDTMADALIAAGWDVISLNTNHTYDTGEPAIQHSHEVWGAHPEVLTIGSYATDAARNRVQLVECNGMRIAFLSYSYGQNGYDQSELPNDYYAVPYVREDMQADVARARTVADAVVVYMHWGTEYEHEPSDTQRMWAQELADAGVDLVIGSHAHVIQPMEWLEGAGGKTLVVYGMGDLWSGYDSYPETILSGMMTCDIVKLDADAAAEAGRGVAIENVVWHPLIEHMEGGSDTVYLVRDYTAEQANANELLTDVVGDRYSWMCDLSHQVIGEGFTIDL